MVRSDDAIIVIDARAIAAPDLATVDALARFALTGRRSGRATTVCGAPERLRRLLELAGLAAVVSCELVEVVR